MRKTERQTVSIITLTPNPALDVSGIVKALTPNEKNPVFSERRDPGGNGINAARIAHRLGAKVLALGFAGGAVGQELLTLIRKEGVPARFVKISGNTRINVTVTHEVTHQQTRLSFSGPEVTRSEWEALLHRIERLPRKALLLLGGSLPPGVPRNFHTRLALLAQKRGIGVVLDVPPQTLSETLKSRSPNFRPLLVKPNESELARWWSQERILQFDSETQRREAGIALARRCELVCVSRGAKGLMFIHGKEIWYLQAPKVQAKGTVGAGDSLLGAISAALAQAGLYSNEQVHKVFREVPEGDLPASIKKALLLGLAAGAATASEVGTSLAQPAQIKRLLAAAERLNSNSAQLKERDR